MVTRNRIELAEKDGNGERIWKAVKFTYYTGSSTALNLGAQRFYLAGKWTERLTHQVEYRINEAKSLFQSDVDQSPYTMGFWYFYGNLVAESYVEWTNSHIPEETIIRLGADIETGHELLALPSYGSQAELSNWGTYLMVILDKNGKVVGVYSGSGTAITGIFTRLKGYDNAKEKSKFGIFPPQLSPRSYMNVVLKNGNTVHIRHIQHEACRGSLQASSRVSDTSRILIHSSSDLEQSMDGKNAQ